MLVLSRKIDQKIKLGEDITLTVIEIRGDKVRLGIDAPESVAVHRQEIYDLIHNARPRPDSNGDSMSE
jgi:carbon storage regulator